MKSSNAAGGRAEIVRPGIAWDSADGQHTSSAERSCRTVLQAFEKALADLPENGGAKESEEQIACTHSELRLALYPIPAARAFSIA